MTVLVYVARGDGEGDEALEVAFELDVDDGGRLASSKNERGSCARSNSEPRRCRSISCNVLVLVVLLVVVLLLLLALSSSARTSSPSSSSMCRKWS
jgi:hypothetical protein